MIAILIASVLGISISLACAYIKWPRDCLCSLWPAVGGKERGTSKFTNLFSDIQILILSFVGLVSNLPFSPPPPLRLSARFGDNTLLHFRVVVVGRYLWNANINYKIAIAVCRSIAHFRNLDFYFYYYSCCCGSCDALPRASMIIRGGRGRKGAGSSSL